MALHRKHKDTESDYVTVEDKKDEAAEEELEAEEPKAAEEEPESAEGSGPEEEPESEDVEVTEGDEPEEPVRKKSKSARKHERKEAKKGSDKDDRKDRASSRKKPAKLHAGLPTGAWVLIAAACLVAGILLGRFVFGAGGALSGSVTGKTTVTEGELDDVMGTYTYNGKSHDVTIRDVIELTSTLDQAKNDDDTYNMPAADGVISAVRNQVLLQEAKNQGIEATDDDVAAYAQEQLGSSDFDTIASQYGLDKDTVVAMITDSATMDKLRKSVVTTETGDMPDAPAEPAEGEESTPTVDYYNYIVDLAGDAWDADKGTWADPAGTYATALANYTISADEGATYEAAQAAYYVAYQEYSTGATAANNEWVNYYNQLFANVTVQLNTAISSAATTTSAS